MSVELARIEARYAGDSSDIGRSVSFLLDALRDANDRAARAETALARRTRRRVNAATDRMRDDRD